MRIRLRPRSIFSVIIIGYVLIALPVVGVAALAAIYASGLTDESNRLLNGGIRIIQSSQSLEDNLTAMDRAVRQYRVLGEPELLTTYRAREASMNAALQDLRMSPQYRLSGWQLDQILANVRSLDAALKLDALKSPDFVESVEQFAEVHKLAQAITTEAHKLIASESNAIEQRRAGYENLLITLSLVLVPLAAGAVILLAYYVILPLRKVDQVIRALGESQLDKSIAINGPEELQRLGRELDWLRTRLLTVDLDKNRFLRQMAHELKTPLASVREGVDLLAEGLLGALSAQQIEVVKILNNNSFELQNLIENLLDFEEWREKYGRLELTLFPMRPLLSQCIHRYKVLLASRNLAVSLQCGEFEVRADRERVRMTLDNLISNAIKFSPQSGTVSVIARLETADPHETNVSNVLIIEVADEGPGIPTRDRENIFDAYFTGKPPAGRHLQGSGIGLAVVSDCVKAHGGTIVVVDQRIPGARFRIRLPFSYRQSSDAILVQS